MSLFNYLKNLVKIYRITDWFHYLGFTVLGLSFRYGFNVDIIKYLLLVSSLLAYAYSFNDFYDKTKKKMFFIFPFILVLLLFPYFNAFQIFSSIILLIIVTLYSARPFRLKTKPIISSLCNGFGFSILFIIGYFFIPVIDYNLFFIILLFALEMVAQFIHETVHLNYDKRRNIITTAVFLGKNKMRKLCHSFLIFTIFIATLMYYFDIIDLLILASTILFALFFILEIKAKGISTNLRNKYRKYGIIVGIIYFFSILRKGIFIFL